MLGKPFIYSENKKIRRKNQAFCSVFLYKLYLRRTKRLKRDSIFQMNSSNKRRRNNELSLFWAPMKQWIWRMITNVYTKTIRQKADGDCRVSCSSGGQRIVRNRHEILRACCKKKLAHKFIKLFSDQLEIQWGERVHRSVYIITILSHEPSWGKPEVWGARGWGRCCVELPPSSKLASTKDKSAYQKYLSASNRHGKAIPYSFLFRKALPFSWYPIANIRA